MRKARRVVRLRLSLWLIILEDVHGKDESLAMSCSISISRAWLGFGWSSYCDARWMVDVVVFCDGGCWDQVIVVFL